MSYPHTPGHKVAGTSAEAAAAAKPRAESLRVKVVELLTHYDLTADECAAKLRESVLTIRPRLSELVRLCRIRDTGERRQNASGKRATVWAMDYESNRHRNQDN